LSSILKALKRIEEKSSRTDSFFTMPKTTDTQQVNNSKARWRWLIPGGVIGFLILLFIAIATINLFSRRQPIITNKFPAEVSDNQKERPASLLVNSNIFKAKIPPRSKNQVESSPKKAQLAKNQTKSSPSTVDTKEMPTKARLKRQRRRSISEIRVCRLPSAVPSRGRRQRLKCRSKRGPHQRRRTPKKQSRPEASHRANQRPKPNNRIEPGPMTDWMTPNSNFRPWHGSVMPPSVWR
jgi:hypothetical protein